MGSIAAVLLLGFLLGFDSFRASVGLGVTFRSADRRRWIPVSFGLCDGLAPLLGLAVGSAAVSSLDPWTGYIGPLIVGGFGLYTLLTSAGDESRQAKDPQAWLCFGLPLSLSLDNLVAGFGLGTLGTPVLLSAAILGLTSGLMSLAGLCLGAAVGRSLPWRADQVGGAALTILALLLALDIA
jgi:putative Mn2+ efflux pump MntP